MVDLIDRICADLSAPRQLVDGALKRAHTRFRKIRVKKRSGGTRTMIQATAELKMVQQWIYENILGHLPDSKIASAFFKGASIVRNAKMHSTSLYSVRIDITEFFRSIRFDDLEHVLRRECERLPDFSTTEECLSILCTACFDSACCLPIGYSTSPKIANSVMYVLDSNLESLIRKNGEIYGKGVLTRYADDFVFSTDKLGGCGRFLKDFRELLHATSSPRLKVNERKTRFMSRRGGSTLITGLRINNDGGVRVHPNYRDHVRLLLKLLSEGKLSEEEVSKLRGHLAFIEHADPVLFTRLSYKYYSLMGKLR